MINLVHWLNYPDTAAHTASFARCYRIRQNRHPIYVALAACPGSANVVIGNLTKKQHWPTLVPVRYAGVANLYFMF